MEDWLDLGFHIDCNGSKVDEETILGLVLVSQFLLVHHLKLFQTLRVPYVIVDQCHKKIKKMLIPYNFIMHNNVKSSGCR